MNRDGTLLAIFITAERGEEPQAVDSVEAIAGKGLEGDRYAEGAGSWSQREEWWNEVTLIEIETVASLQAAGMEVEPAELRRNLLTRGVALNELVGREFTVGPVRLRGERLCDPCRYLEGLTVPGMKKALENRGGLRATIVQEGAIAVGDAIRIIRPSNGGRAAG